MLPTALGHAPDPTPTSSPSQMVGQRYSLREAVGSGGMGTVWRSHDELLRRDVAIKEVVIPPGVPSKERELLCERMLREARAAAALNHPAVVSIFDVVTDLGRPWIVMELLDARSIADIIKDDGPLPVRDVVEIGLAVLGALDTAHNAGVLHRDVNPRSRRAYRFRRRPISQRHTAYQHGTAAGFTAVYCARASPWPPLWSSQ